MNEAIKTLYILFLKWDFPLIRYNGEVYFSDNTFVKYTYLDRFANQEVNEFLNKYAIIDNQKELDYYNKAIRLYVSGEEIKEFNHGQD